VRSCVKFPTPARVRFMPKGTRVRTSGRGWTGCPCWRIALLNCPVERERIAPRTFSSSSPRHRITNIWVKRSHAGKSALRLLPNAHVVICRWWTHDSRCAVRKGRAWPLEHSCRSLFVFLVIMQWRSMSSRTNSRRLRFQPSLNAFSSHSK